MLPKMWIGVLAVALCGAAVFGYRAYARYRDLSETLQWMDQTYNPHEGGENYSRGHGEEIHFLVRANHDKELTQSFHQTFSYKGRCTIVIHSETLPLGLHKDVYTNGDYTVNLCDVDPNTIQIHKYDLHKDVFNYADPEEVSLYQLNCDAAEIEFHSRNEAPKFGDDSITTFAKLTGNDHESRHNGKTNLAWFITDNAVYAERFAKALKHAVELCGGQASKF